MSSKAVHYSTGVLFGGAIVYATQHVFSPWQLLTIFMGCLWGSSAPDWMEISGWTWWGKRLSIIPHRTITHWLAGWLVLFGWVAIQTYREGTFAWCISFGFCFSGLVHVLMDAQTPMGVPLLHPYKRKGRPRGRH